MDENIEYEEMMPELPKKRPTVLTIICILSSVNAALNAFTNLMAFLFYKLFNTILSDDNEELMSMSQMFGNEWDEMLKTYRVFFSTDRIYFIMNALVWIGSFIGVSMMWKLKKNGFHIYTISQILVLILSTIFIYNRTGGSPVMDVLMTAIFVVWYLRYYKQVMK